MQKARLGRAFLWARAARGSAQARAGSALGALDQFDLVADFGVCCHF
jgi:hypothetical protein